MKEKVRKMEKRANLGFSGSIILLAAALLCINLSAAQSFTEENKKIQKETNEFLRNAEKELGDNDFASAEASYRKAISKNTESVAARYNMANMYYGKEKPAQAAARLRQAAEVAETKEEKHKIFHNLGNSFMEQKNYKGAVEAYKQALRNNPKDEETRYNLALAKKMLEKEEQEGGGGEDDQEQQDDQNKDDQNKGDQGDKEQDKQEGQDKQDPGGDQNEDSKQEPEKDGDKGDPKEGQEENGQPEQPQPAQPQPGQLSPEQVKSLLEAMNNEERKVQDKINAQKAKGAKTRNEKDW